MKAWSGGGDSESDHPVSEGNAALRLCDLGQATDSWCIGPSSYAKLAETSLVPPPFP